MRLAEEVWVALALLHQENPERNDFSGQEIEARARKEAWNGSLRPGFYQHVSYHAVATKPPHSADHRMLCETGRGRRRLYHSGDSFHPDRSNGKLRPEKSSLPPQYRALVDWYDNVYSAAAPDALASNSSTSSPPTPQENRSPHKSDIADEMLRVIAGKVNVGSGGAVVIPEFLRNELGIREGTLLSTYRDGNRLILQPVNEVFIDSLLGSLKGDDSLLEAREREHRVEKDRLAR